MDPKELYKKKLEEDKALKKELEEAKKEKDTKIKAIENEKKERVNDLEAKIENKEKELGRIAEKNNIILCKRCNIIYQSEELTKRTEYELVIHEIHRYCGAPDFDSEDVVEPDNIVTKVDYYNCPKCSIALKKEKENIPLKIKKVKTSEAY